MEKCLLIKYGELAIRGKNRYIFENKLIDSIKNNIKDYENYYVIKEQGRLVILNNKEDFDYDLIINKVKNIIGISKICPCFITNNNSIENLKNIVLNYLKLNYSNNKNYTFKVETKRADKKYIMTSNEISSTLGEHIINNFKNYKVNLNLPDIKIFVELRTKVYIYSKNIKCIGGLPVGISGKGLLLLSGGIDSPVAGFLMQKRGIEIECLYFHSPPYTSYRAKEKVIDLVKVLSKFSLGIKLNIVNFTEIQTMLYKKVPEVKLTIFLKRAMLKLADKLVEQKNCQCIVLGDSIGQVASQTIKSIKAIDSAAKNTIIRPLACFDKQEIIDLAEKIGTFEISIRPFEDCCTIFLAKHPETKPKKSIIENMELKINNLDEMIDKAIENIEIINL